MKDNTIHYFFVKLILKMTKLRRQCTAIYNVGRASPRDKNSLGLLPISPYPNSTSIIINMSLMDHQ